MLAYAHAGLPLVAGDAAPGRRARGSSLDERLCAQLIERLRAGDLQAFDSIYRHTREDVARTLFHLLGSRAEVEDLLQEVFVRLLRTLRAFRGESTFRTFLYRVCANVALSHLRWRRRRPEDCYCDVPDTAHAATTPEDELARREAMMLVHAALAKLAPKKRIVFVYHQLLGMKPEEIAEAVDASVNTVRSRLHHARLEFHAAMERSLRPRLSVVAR